MLRLVMLTGLTLAWTVLLGCRHPGAAGSQAAAPREVGPTSTGESRSGDDAARTLAREMNRFSLVIYRQTAEAGRNSFLSPFSIYTALAMVSAGATGETRSEMDRLLLGGGGPGNQLTPEELPSAAHSLIASLRESSGREAVVLNVANALWVQQGFPLKDTFVSALRSDYEAGLSSLDFLSRPEPSREEINRWTADKTGGRIDPLLPPGSLSEDTRLVLTNAVYFLGNWTDQFDERLTGPGDFLRPTGVPVKAQFMRRTGTYRVNSGEDGTVIELPYRGDRLALLILMPTGTEGLRELTSVMTPEWLRERLAELQSMRVELSLPRFKIESKMDLSGALSDMGIPRAFRPGEAEFEGISDQGDLFVRKVFHGAFVEVNERGTEAAAATGISMEITMMPPLIRIDRPFLFAIHDRKTGAILFLGQVNDPTAG